jgi:hypothetical protein
MADSMARQFILGATLFSSVTQAQVRETKQEETGWWRVMT